MSWPTEAEYNYWCDVHNGRYDRPKESAADRQRREAAHAEAREMLLRVVAGFVPFGPLVVALLQSRARVAQR